MSMSLLQGLLSTPRRHGSVGEIATGRLLANHYGFTEYQDDKGNALAYIKWVGASKILWSCHIDTAHATGAGTEQEITFDTTETMMAAAGTQPLGADNGAGMWLLLEMIAAKVPGMYVFHRGEECGGIGSRGMAEYWPTIIEGYTHAIAFDRRGRRDVITHQFPGRCCSEDFANQLCTLLNMDHEPDDSGSFTDTASYTTLIPECTNVSVGYDNEHTARETLDLEYLTKLRDRVIEVFKALPELIVKRKVTDTDDDRWSPYDYLTGGSWGRVNKVGSTLPRYKTWDGVDPADMSEYDVLDMSTAELTRQVKEDPEGYTDLLVRFAQEMIYYRDMEDSRLEDADDVDDSVITARSDELSMLDR